MDQAAPDREVFQVPDGKFEWGLGRASGQDFKGFIFASATTHFSTHCPRHKTHAHSAAEIALADSALKSRQPSVLRQASNDLEARVVHVGGEHKRSLGTAGLQSYQHISEL